MSEKNLSSTTEPMQPGEEPQRHEALVYVGTRCTGKCNKHVRDQVWALPRSASMREVACWRCGAPLQFRPSVKVRQSIFRGGVPVHA